MQGMDGGKARLNVAKTNKGETKRGQKSHLQLGCEERWNRNDVEIGGSKN